MGFLDEPEHRPLKGLNDPDQQNCNWDGIMDLPPQCANGSQQLSTTIFPPVSSQPEGSADKNAAVGPQDDMTTWQWLHLVGNMTTPTLSVLVDTAIRQRGTEAATPMPYAQAFKDVGTKFGVVGAPMVLRLGLDSTLFKNKDTTAVTTITDIATPFAALAVLPKLGPLKTIALSVLAHVGAKMAEDDKPV